jgi:hypothetical protein
MLKLKNQITLVLSLERQKALVLQLIDVPRLALSKGDTIVTEVSR